MKKHNELKVLSGKNFFRSPCPFITMKATVDVDFNPSKLKKAVNQVTKKYPVLMYAVKEDENGNITLRHDDSSGLHVTIQKNTSTHERWKEIIIGFNNFKRAYDINLAHIYILVGKGQFDIILFVNHLLADGLAVRNLFSDLLKAYFNVLPDFEPQEPAILEDFLEIPKAAKLPPEAVAKLEGLNQALAATGKRFTDQDCAKLIEKWNNQNGMGIETVHIDKQVYHHLQQVCHDNGITLNALLVTGALAVLQTNESDNIAIPIDIRRRVSNDPKVAELFGFGVTGIMVDVGYDRSKSFIENCKIIDVMLKEKIGSINIYAMVQFLNVFSVQLFQAGMFSSAGMFDHPIMEHVRQAIGTGNGGLFYASNVGVSTLGIEKVRDITYLPNISVTYKFALGMYTVDDNLAISCIFRSKLVRTKQVNMAVQSFLDYILSV